MALPYADNTFDAVVSLGTPLSHITSAEARAATVAELTRVVKPRGMILLTGLQRLAGYRGIVYWLDEGFFEQITAATDRKRGIIDGSQVWYNFAPGELEALVQQTGLKIIDRIGCEGLANHLPLDHLEKVEADPRYWPIWKTILLETCNEPSIIGISNHLLVVARKP